MPCNPAAVQSCADCSPPRCTPSPWCQPTQPAHPSEVPCERAAGATGQARHALAGQLQRGALPRQALPAGPGCRDNTNHPRPHLPRHCRPHATRHDRGTVDGHVAAGSVIAATHAHVPPLRHRRRRHRHHWPAPTDGHGPSHHVGRGRVIWNECDEAHPAGRGRRHGTRGHHPTCHRRLPASVVPSGHRVLRSVQDAAARWQRRGHGVRRHGLYHGDDGGGVPSPAGHRSIAQKTNS